MKPHTIDLTASHSIEAAMRSIAMMRFSEVLALSTALRKRQSADLHAFRIACKRMRYTLERFTPLWPSLSEAAAAFTTLQDTLGEAHDRDVLVERLGAQAPKTTRRLQHEREACVNRAAGLWKDAFAALGPFDGLLRFIRFS